jgi:hypothetical protein
MAQQHAEQQRVGAGAPPRLATLLLHVWRSRLWVLFLVCFIFSLVRAAFASSRISHINAPRQE